MPDLEKQIAEWRRQMLAAGIKSPVPLEELESHLRDDIEQQMRTGVSVQPAFDVAVERLGHAHLLKREFKRAHYDIRTVSPIFMRVYCFLAPLFLFGMIWGFTDGETSPSQRYFGLVSVSLMALYVGGLPMFYRRLFAKHYRLMYRVLQVGNVVTIIWLLAAIGVFSTGKVVGLLLWSMLAAQVATVLACANFDREALAKQAVELAGS